MHAALSRFVPHLVKALEAGRISSAEALQATLKGKTAIVALLNRADNRQSRRPTIRKPRQYPLAVTERAVSLVQNRVKRRSRNLRSIHWGVRQVCGRRTNETAVVVHVATKRSPRQLRASKRTPFPKSVTVRYRGRRYVCPVDVQGVGSSAALHLGSAEPGDHAAILVGGEAVGALGAIVLGSDNLSYAVTAGHVAEAIGTGTARCSDLDAGVFSLGRVKCNQLAEGDDVAAIGPVTKVPAGAVGPTTFARDATNADVHDRVFFFLPESFTAIESHIEGVNVTGVFSTPSGTVTLTGLTAVDRVTRSGDSGAPALDVHGDLIGFVVGADATRTFLLPARRALDALENCL